MAYVPLISYILYSTAGPIIPLQSLVSYSFLGICCLFSFYAMMHIKATSFIKTIYFFLLIEFVYFLFTDKIIIAADGWPIENWGYMKGIIWTFVPFFFTYYLTSTGNLTSKHMLVFCAIYLPFLIAFFFWNKVEMINKAAENGRIVTDITNNSGYEFMHLLILLPLMASKRFLSVAYIALLSFFIVLSAKKGCMIIAVMIFLFYLPSWLREKRNRKVGFIIVIVLAILVAVAVRYFSEYEYLVERLELMSEGYTSHRDEIAEDIWDYCFHKHFSFQTLLFGYGFNYSWCMAGQSAHNDWLELLASHGLFGIITYLVFFFQMFKEFRKVNDPELKKMAFIVLMIWFTSTFFSQGYGQSDLVALFMGFVFGRNAYETAPMIKCRKQTNNIELKPQAFYAQ